MKHAYTLGLSLILSVLAGCGGGSNANTPSADPFIELVQTITQMMPEDTEPMVTTDISTTQLETAEPLVF